MLVYLAALGGGRKHRRLRTESSRLSGDDKKKFPASAGLRHGKTMGKRWENHGKTMGKPWEKTTNKKHKHVALRCVSVMCGLGMSRYPIPRGLNVRHSAGVFLLAPKGHWSNLIRRVGHHSTSPTKMRSVLRKLPGGGRAFTNQPKDTATSCWGA